MQRSWRLLLLVIFGLGSCAAPVRVEDVEGKAVSKVAIRYHGPRTVEEARLRTHIGTTAGSVYKSDRVDNDIKALYESGLVNDVRVLAKPKRIGVEVVFKVQTRGAICCSGFAGNTVFSDQRLAKQTGIRVGQKIDGPILTTAARRIEAYYQARGYPGTRVIHRSESGVVIFIIEEGPGPG
ncbi:hypothetical protein OKA05_22840 [Luteolibacter arcticus]|uniref:POTRA domain-containing protein n=1 Tax=Luteolibacter arcticus TaxID=1581411 RepID=A0ABT3GPH0_9BACT|nr:POTRA domain-containing protein [Luteolibacter arcticus]MCW1925416.1 hypothetical protein [Luteolibacter arcticus]